MRYVLIDSDDGGSTETGSMDSTTDTASDIAIVMKDKKMSRGMRCPTI